MAAVRTLVQLTLGLILLARTASGQASNTDLPCAFDGPLLRDSTGHIVQYKSDEMKQRAIFKEDLKGFIKQVDFRSVMVLKLLVSESGTVTCAKTISGINLAQKPTEEAVRRWKFRVATEAGKPVAFIGWLEFTLCNTSCGSQPMGVALLR